VKEFAASREDFFVDFRVSLDLFLAFEVNPLKIGVFDILPINISEVKISMQFFSILASLHFTPLLYRSVLQLLEPGLWKVRYLSYLCSAEPLLPIGTALAVEERKKPHFLLKPLIIVLLRVYLRLGIELWLLRMIFWELYLHHSRNLMWLDRNLGCNLVCGVLTAFLGCLLLLSLVDGSLLLVYIVVVEGYLVIVLVHLLQFE
jgi:hypothetical protein